MSKKVKLGLVTFSKMDEIKLPFADTYSYVFGLKVIEKLPDGTNLAKPLEDGIYKVKKEGVYKVEMLNEFPDGTILVKPLQCIKGHNVLFDDYSLYVKKEEVKDITPVYKDELVSTSKAIPFFKNENSKETEQSEFILEQGIYEVRLSLPYCNPGDIKNLEQGQMFHMPVVMDKIITIHADEEIELKFMAQLN